MIILRRKGMTIRPCPRKGSFMVILQRIRMTLRSRFKKR